MGGGESRSGKKIRGAVRPVPVRVRPPAPKCPRQVARWIDYQSCSEASTWLASEAKTRVPNYLCAVHFLGWATDFGSTAMTCRERLISCFGAERRSCLYTAASGMPMRAATWRNCPKPERTIGKPSSRATLSAINQVSENCGAWDGALSQYGSAKSQGNSMYSGG